MKNVDKPIPQHVTSDVKNMMTVHRNSVTEKIKKEHPGVEGKELEDLVNDQMHKDLDSMQKAFEERKKRMKAN